MGDSTNIDELERFAALYERGLINQDEFERQKSRLLSSHRVDTPLAPQPREALIEIGQPPSNGSAFKWARRNKVLLLSAAGLLAVIAVLTIVVWGADAGPGPALPVSEAPGDAVTTTLPPAPPLDNATAMLIAFGTTDPVANVVWQGSTLRVVYEAEKLLTLSAGKMALISTGRVEDYGHVTPGFLAIHYLSWNGTAWIREGSWPQFMEGGSFGSPGEVTTGRGLFVGPTVQLEGGWMGQGCMVNYIDLIELTPERPVLRAKNILSSFEYPDPSAPEGSTGANPEEGHGSTEGKLTILVRGRSFKMTYDGDFARVVTHVRKGETYRAESPAKQLPGC